MNTRHLFRITVTVFASLLSATTAFADVKYTVIDLGTLGGRHSQAHAINADGYIVGEAMLADGTTHAFLTSGKYSAIDPEWDDLGTLGGVESRAYGINFIKQVVGSSVDSAGMTQAFEFSDGKMHGLGFLDEGHMSAAYAINKDGYLVGEADTMSHFGGNSTIAYRAVGATLGSISDLGTPDGLWTKAYGVNDAGIAVGMGSSPGGYFYRAFKNDGTTTTDIGTLGGDHSFARKINSAGLIVGGSEFASGSPYHAFRYDGLMKDLKTLGGPNSAAYGVNVKSQIVGYSETASGAIHAFIWDSVNGMRDLNGLIDPASGFELTLAEDINDDGCIVGYGTIGGDQHAYLLKPDATLKSLVIDPTIICEEKEATGHVTLVSPAPPGGVWITLKVDNPAVADVPVGVTVPEFTDKVDFTIKGLDVPMQKVAHVTAEYNGLTKSDTVVVNTLLWDVKVDPATVTSGAGAKGKVRLKYSAPDGGVTITLSSSSGLVSVPASIFVAAGDMSGDFDVTTTGVEKPTKVTIAATLRKASATAALTLKPLYDSLTLVPPVTFAPIPSKGVVKLNSPAPAGGITVAVSSGDTSVATVPASITIPAGSDTGEFDVTVLPVLTDKTVVISASIGGVTKTATLKVGTLLKSITFVPMIVCGGESTVGTVTLKMADPKNPVVVKLTSNDASVPVPATVTVPAGAASVNFTVVTTNPDVIKKATVTATLAGISKTVMVTVKPYHLAAIICTPAKVKGGEKVTITVKLTCDAPAAGATVKLTSDNVGALKPPATLVIPAGSNSATVEVTTTKVAKTTNVKLTAEFNGSSVETTATVRP